MKRILFAILIVSSFSFGQYRKSAMEAWYNDVVKARITDAISDSLVTNNLYGSVAGVDSFTTTAASDSITVGSGFGNFSRVVITPFNPAWSTAVDTSVYSGQVVTTGVGLIKLVVSRVKSYTGNGATAVKSGAHYFYEVKK